MGDQSTPDPVFTLRGDMGAIHSVCFQITTDSEYLYAATQAGIVHKWNLQSCREVHRSETSEKACIAVKSFGNCYISQAKGGEIKIWYENEGKWKLKNTINLDYWGFCKFDIFGDENLVCPQSGSKVKIINFDGKAVTSLTPSTNEKCGEIMVVKCLCVSGTIYIFVLYESGVLTLFKNNGDKVTEVKISSDCPMALDFDGESKGVIGSSGDTIVGFELTNDLRIVKGKQAVITNPGVSCVVIRPDRKLFAAGCWDARIRLFSMKSFKLLAVLVNHKETIQDVCYSPVRVNTWNTQWLLAAAGKDGRITLWNLY